MKNNASLRQIGEQIENAESVLILSHISPDGDAMGSSIALCETLRNLGKTSYVIIEEEFPEYISFLDSGCCTQQIDIVKEPDVTICVDCSEDNRISNRLEAFNGGKIKICIDHHINDKGYGDYYYIDENAGAASELVYLLIDEMGWQIDVHAATCLYTGIVTDTGSFQYSSTTPQTHQIAASLIGKGVDVNRISVKLFQNVSLGRSKAEAKIVDNMVIFADGKGVISYIDNRQLEAIDATYDDTEAAIDRLRDIHGVEIAGLLKPKGDGIKVSMRAKNDSDVQQIAAKFDGGGHKKAAGCTIVDDMDVAIKLIKDAITESLEN